MARRETDGSGLQSQSSGGFGRGGAQELGAADALFLFADRPCGPRERTERPQEPLVGLVFPGDRTLPTPAGFAQSVSAPVSCVVFERSARAAQAKEEVGCAAATRSAGVSARSAVAGSVGK